MRIEIIINIACSVVTKQESATSILKAVKEEEPKIVGAHYQLNNCDIEIDF
jgi:hypothetical protein